MIQLEGMVWVVFDNIMGLGEALPLSGLEIYAQIIECLAGKAYRGQHVHCPARTSASFGAEAMSRPRPGGPEPKKPGRPQCYSMMRDVRKEFVGLYSALKEKQDLAGGDQSSAPFHPVDPNIQGMKRMKECQHSYRDVQLDFQLLLRPLMDGGEESTHQLACRPLSMWHWSSDINLPTYPPAPTSMNIGYRLRESRGENKRQSWIEAYACALQCVAEASMGQRLITERGTRVPKISRLVEIFLNATGTRVSPNIIWQCLPVQHENTLVQKLGGIRHGIVHKLDEAVTQCTSSIVWDKFAFPQMDQEFWREEALCYHSGKTLHVRARMTGFRLMLQDDKGQYPNSGCTLIFEGSMLVYDPQHDSVQWVPVWGMSATLTMMKLRVANDLNNMVPLPYSEVELVRPPPPKSSKVCQWALRVIRTAQQ